MSYFIASMGKWAIPQIIISAVILVLSIKKVIDLYFRKDLAKEDMVKGLHAILFWGGITAVIGFLGQVSGMYNAMLAISSASALSPAVIAAGFGQSLTTTIYGLVTLIISGIIWFVLLGRYNRLMKG